MSTTTGRPTKKAALHLTRPYHWRDDAACREVEPETFFPVGAGTAARVQEAQAKLVCAGCPVRSECLDWAIETGQTTGVWGGLSEHERRALPDGIRGQYERCIEAQDYIERRIAENATYRKIAQELMVGHHAVCRAAKLFRDEREALVQDEAVEAA